MVLGAGGRTAGVNLTCWSWHVCVWRGRTRGSLSWPRSTGTQDMREKESESQEADAAGAERKVVCCGPPSVPEADQGELWFPDKM